MSSHPIPEVKIVPITPMNPEWKAKWVAALRSRKYKQTRGKLKGKYGFCCLGVLCDVVDPSKWDSSGYYDGFNSTLPPKVSNIVGLGNLDSPYVRLRGGHERYLIELNDLNKYNFAKIADIIEKQL